MSGHALLSASSAKRWLNCPPSARMCERLGERTSAFAEEGTLAHELAALKLERARGPVPDLAERLEKIESSDLYDAEMQRFTDEYAEYVEPASAELLWIEKRVDFSNAVPEGFGTADCIAVRGDELGVYDLKYGRGVKVEAPYNPQLMLYALGALNAVDAEVMGIRRLRLHIVQPRLDNVSTFALSLRELDEFAAEVRRAAPLAFEGRGEPRAGDWCRFCAAKGVCRASRDLAAEAAKRINGDLNCMTPDELGTLLDLLDDLDGIREKARERALEMILGGTKIQGYKAVAGRSVRRFTNEEEAVERLQKASGVSLYETRPLSLAKIEKILGKKRFNEIAGDCVCSPPGAPTLAKAGDPRREYKAGGAAEEALKNIDVNEL